MTHRPEVLACDWPDDFALACYKLTEEGFTVTCVPTTDGHLHVRLTGPTGATAKGKFIDSPYNAGWHLMCMAYDAFGRGKTYESERSWQKLLGDDDEAAAAKAQATMQRIQDFVEGGTAEGNK
jgi:hypothetical protein